MAVLLTAVIRLLGYVWHGQMLQTFPLELMGFLTFLDNGNQQDFHLGDAYDKTTLQVIMLVSEGRGLNH